MPGQEATRLTAELSNCNAETDNTFQVAAVVGSLCDCDNEDLLTQCNDSLKAKIVHLR